MEPSSPSGGQDPRRTESARGPDRGGGGGEDRTGAGAGKTDPFSIVMCFRDTPKEREFAQRSIPSAIRLGPSEFVIGIDEPVRDDLPGHITGICEKNGFENVRLIRVPNTRDWNLQLAHAYWECYLACKHDRILVLDTDNILEREVMLGYDAVGTDGIAVVSFTKKLLTRTPGDYMRNVLYRLRVRRSDDVFSGIYWIYKPYYFVNVKRDAFQKINNKIDGYMIAAIMRQKTHKIVMRKEIGVSCMDYQNEDYPWHQFARGIWMYANMNTLKTGKTILKNRGTGSLIRTVIAAVNRFPFLFALIYAMTYQYPLIISGWRWAAKHRGSEAVADAAGISCDDWMIYRYAKHMRKIGKFGGGTTGLA